jgi:peroxiredoxin
MADSRTRNVILILLALTPACGTAAPPSEHFLAAKSAAASPSVDEPKKPEPLDVAFAAPDGKVVHLSDYRGKRSVVLLVQRGYADGYACFYCSKQTNEYKDSYARLQAADAEVLMVLPGSRDADGYLKAVGQMSDDHSAPSFLVPFPVLGDLDFAACKALLVPHEDAAEGFPVSQPATFVVSKDGAVLLAYHGKDPSDRPTVDAVLAVLRAGKPVEPSTLAAPAAASAPARPTLAWVPFDEGMRAAREQKRPVLLEFYADW